MTTKKEEDMTKLLGECKTSLKKLEKENPPELITSKKNISLAEDKEGEKPAPAPAPIPEEEAFNTIKELKKVLESTYCAIERTNKTLESANRATEAQARYAFESKETGKKTLHDLDKIKEIAEADRKERTEIFEFVYPIGGGEQAIPAGTTVIDIENGEVILADGTRDKLDNSLNWVGQEYARSLFIDAKKAFTVKLDDKVEHTVGPDDFFFRTGTQCKTVSIVVSESTSIKFWGSTNPNATLEEARRTEITGIDKWYYLSYDEVLGGMYVMVSIYSVPENYRLKVESITITCSKSCIQLLEFCISTPSGTDFWRTRRYDTNDVYRLDNVILTAGQTLKVRYTNLSGEVLKFHVEILGLMEKV